MSQRISVFCSESLFALNLHVSELLKCFAFSAALRETEGSKTFSRSEGGETAYVLLYILLYSWISFGKQIRDRAMISVASLWWSKIEERGPLIFIFRCRSCISSGAHSEPRSFSKVLLSIRGPAILAQQMITWRFLMLMSFYHKLSSTGVTGYFVHSTWNEMSKAQSTIV